MPFIDLNSANSQPSQSGGPGVQTQATQGAQQSSPTPPPTPTPPVVPTDGVREVKGPAFSSGTDQQGGETTTGSVKQAGDVVLGTNVQPLQQSVPASSPPETAQENVAIPTPGNTSMPAGRELSVRPTGATGVVPSPAAPATEDYSQLGGAPVSESQSAVNVLEKEEQTPTMPELPPLSPSSGEPEPSTNGSVLPSALPSLPTSVASSPQGAVSPVQTGGLQSKTYTLQEMLSESVKMGASDLHLSAGYRAIARVDGKLTTIRSQMLDHESIKAMLQDVVKPLQKANLDVDRDLDLSYQISDPPSRFRVNIFRQKNTLSGVFRVIPSRIRTPEELYLPPVVKEFTKLSQGLVLVTGPTGSGKTTTLASLINLINTAEPKHIITIEDPIEYVYPQGMALVDQRAVYIDTKDWAKSLRAALRQDPDVVLIGEMRDTETMESALQIAETGHLVFSTLHTNSASQTIDRVIDAFPENKQNQVRTQLAGVLMAVVSQRLLPITGGGRRVAAEIMVVTPAIRNAIRENKVYQIDNMIQTGAELGMIPLEKSLVTLVRQGMISTELAQIYANHPDDLLSLLGKNR